MCILQLHSLVNVFKNALRELFVICQIIEPKLRSPKWISTSATVENGKIELAKYSSAEYHVNTSVSPVRFHVSIHMPRKCQIFILTYIHVGVM